MSGTKRTAFATGAIAAVLTLLFYIAVRLASNGTVLTPIESFTDWLAPNLPMSAFEAGISTFGGYAKVLLDVGVVIAIIVLGGLVSIAFSKARAKRSNLSSSDGTAVLAVILSAFTLLIFLPVVGQGPLGTRSAAGPLVTSLYYIGGILIFALVAGIGYELNTQPVQGPLYDRSRRRFLKRALYGGGAALVVVSVGSIVSQAGQSATITNVKKKVSNLPAKFTPNNKFYKVSKNFVDPTVDASQWKLSIGGMVDQPYTLTLDQLKEMPSVEQDQTLSCISNPVGGNLISNARWKGIRLRDLLDKAGVKDGTVDLKLSAVDSYIDSIPIEKGMEEGVVLAYEMNGKPLPDDHGGPARLLVPNIYGMKNVKWLTSVEAVSADFKGFWEHQGWSDIAKIKTLSQIRTPDDRSQAKSGEQVQVAGIAFAGSRGIRKVEWSFDGGKTWKSARLQPEIGQYCWRFWQDTWTPKKAGTYHLAVRATDGNGKLQTSEEASTLPDGASGYDSITVSVG